MKKEDDGLTEKQKAVISGLGSYATHKGISFNEWQANRLIANDYLQKIKVEYIEFKY